MPRRRPSCQLATDVLAENRRCHQVGKEVSVGRSPLPDGELRIGGQLIDIRLGPGPGGDDTFDEMPLSMRWLAAVA